MGAGSGRGEERDVVIIAWRDEYGWREIASWGYGILVARTAGPIISRRGDCDGGVQGHENGNVSLVAVSALWQG